ncbi:glycosyl hydrolase family 28 protein [Haloferax sp. Q22]|uniref:glycosyl hydrolase family 28 protein n=1 Tax=Haloferax sp. (strain Q22) TaxID=1526048 RepID=UPI000A49C849|nr:glycosyl hydrolase family 28 protein [Haloferax sp. Q22]
MPPAASAFDVTAYADETDDLQTEAFQTAIDDCSESGGGTVTVPSGTYTVGTVHLRSNVTLYLEAGAVVSPAKDESEYTDKFIGPDNERIFFLAEDVENVTIAGEGEFDGLGTEFMRMDTPIQGHSNESASHPLISNGPHEARQGDAYLSRTKGTDGWPVAKPDFRPGPMFRFNNCTNVRIRDVTIRDMPAWTLSFHGTEEVDIRGVDILNHLLIPNCDGIALGDTKNVHISDCTIQSCDDSITFGARPDEPVTCEGIVVTNCTLRSSACAIKFGSGTDDTIRDCLFQNIVVQESNRGLGIQHRDSGVVENVLFTDIVVNSNMLPGPWWGKGEPIYVTSVPRDDDTDLGGIRNVRFSNIVARSENGALVYGSEDSDIETIEFDNVRIELTGSEHADEVGGNFDLQPSSVVTPIFANDIAGVHVENARDVTMRDVTVEWDEDGDLPDYYRSGLACEDVDGLLVDGFVGRQAHRDDDAAAISLADTTDITVRNSRATEGTGTFLSLSNTDSERLFVNNDLIDAADAGDVESFERSGNALPR